MPWNLLILTRLSGQLRQERSSRKGKRKPHRSQDEQVSQQAGTGHWYLDWQTAPKLQSTQPVRCTPLAPPTVAQEQWTMALDRVPRSIE